MGQIWEKDEDDTTYWALDYIFLLCLFDHEFGCLFPVINVTRSSDNINSVIVLWTKGKVPDFPCTTCIVDCIVYCIEYLKKKVQHKRFSNKHILGISWVWSKFWIQDFVYSIKDFAIILWKWWKWLMFSTFSSYKCFRVQFPWASYSSWNFEKSLH